MHIQNEIRIAAALIWRADGKTLLVRKRGSSSFMQPGGKIEPHETAIQALCRELQEELALSVEQSEAAYLGSFSAPAANEPGFVVTAELFQLTISTPVSAAAELEEICWIDPVHPGNIQLAPLTRDYVLKLHKSS